MTNLLRKFAEMFVEFDEDEAGSKGKAGDSAGKQPSSGENVLAAIEKIRTDLEQEGHTDFDEAEDVLDPGLLAANRREQTADSADEAKSFRINIGEPDAAADGQQPEQNQPRSSAPISEGAEHINVPKLLSIEEVYTRAQIAAGPSQVNRIAEMLNDPELEGLPMDIRARSVKMALKASGIGLESILEDAGRRDQALEDYSFYLKRKVEQIDNKVQEDNASLQQEIDEFVRLKQEQMERNKRSLAEAVRIRDEFAQAKQAEEKRLYEIVTPFVSPGDNPVELT